MKQRDIETKEQANRLVAQNELNKAKIIFEHLLSIYPDQIDILQSLAFIAFEQNDLEESKLHFQNALEISNHAELHNNLAFVLTELNEYDEALKHLQLAIHMNPECIEAYNNIANVFASKGKYQLAIDYYYKTIELKPEFAEAHNNLANILSETGNAKQAIIHYETAIRLKPDYLKASINLAFSHYQNGETDKALSLFQVLYKSFPRDSYISQGLGLIFAKNEQFSDAVYFLNQAIQLESENPDHYNNLGLTLVKINQLYQAEDIYKLGLEKSPNSIHILCNLALIYQYSLQHEKALNCYKRAFEYEQDSYLYSKYLLFLCTQLNLKPSEMFSAFKGWQSRFSDQNEPGAKLYGNDRIVIGYLSPYFRAHSASSIFYTLIKNHQRKQFKIVAFSDSDQVDHVTDKFIEATDLWIDISQMSSTDVIEVIKKNKIDILIECTGHTGQHRLDVFSKKPAPISVTGLGFGKTTGLTQIDYLFSDKYILPFEAIRWNSEKVLYLSSLLHWQPPDFDIEITSLPCLKNQYITFGSSNSVYKISKIVMDVWIEIMLATPSSKIILKAEEFDSEYIRDKFSRYFETSGISPDRFSFRGKTSQFEHLKCLQSIDILLDPFPHNGGISTCESLWMGVPVLILANGLGPGLSIMSQIDMESWVAFTTEELVEKGIQFAKDISKLSLIRQSLRDKFLKSKVCDPLNYTLEIEQAYLMMYHTFLQKQDNR